MMQVFLTVISGVIIYVFGQIILHFVLEPIKEFNKQRGDTSFLLLSYRAQITNASKVDTATKKELKEMGAALVAYMMQIPLYDSFALLRILPPKDDVFKAAQEINGIVYQLTGDAGDGAIENYKALQAIANFLKIKTSFG